MTTAAISARTLGAARSESVAIMSRSAMCAGAITTATAVPGAMSWYRLDGFGFPVNHKRPTRRPPSPTS
jgi:hypothetical protein